MHVPSIKLLCWLTSATLLASLALYGHDFFKHQQEKLYPVDRDHVEAVLTHNLQVAAEVKEGLSYTDQMKPSFLDMNWCGRHELSEVSGNPGAGTKTEPGFRALATVLNVLMIREDTTDPGGSAAYVRYVDSGKRGVLTVGSRLPEPHEAVVVHSIHADGVVFTFTERNRPNEMVAYPDQDREGLIMRLGDDAAEAPHQSRFPSPRAERERPRRTQQVSDTMWDLGDDDLEHFAKHLSDILTHDVELGTYRDAEGRRAGIEIHSVKVGSIAARHGAQDGDVIISINGHKVSSQQEAIQFVKSNHGTVSAWNVLVLRLGKLEILVYTDK